MKTSAIVCAVLAGTLGFSSLASAAPGDHRNRGDRAEQREARQERRDARVERRVDRAFDRGVRTGAAQQPRYVVQQPRYVYSQPSYRSTAPRYYRGGYLPYEHRQHARYVSDWHSHRGLYAPPQGHQWMQVGSDFLLVALATGLIANLLTQ